MIGFWWSTIGLCRNTFVLGHSHMQSRCPAAIHSNSTVLLSRSLDWKGSQVENYENSARHSKGATDCHRFRPKDVTRMWPGDPVDAKRLAAHTVRPEGPGMLRTRHCHHLSRFNLKFHSKPSNYTHMIEEFVMWLCRFWVNEYIYIYITYIHNYV